MPKRTLHPKRGFKTYVMKRDRRKDGSYICHYCGCKLATDKRKQYTPTYLTIDHKVNKAAGGTDDGYNLVLACLACNKAKGDMPYGEFVKLKRKG